MADTNISTATVSNMTNNVTDYSVPSTQLDGVQGTDETTWTFVKWNQNLGYYKSIPEIKIGIDALARWATSKGYTADTRTTVILDHVKGYGEDSFRSVLKNLVIVSYINGDSFAEIIRDPSSKVLINLKPLDPSSMRVVVDSKGIIKRYEQISKIKGLVTKFNPSDILHITQGRIGDEIHGVSIIDAVAQILLMRNEALTDYQKVLHRNVYPFKIWHLDTDDQNKINAFITKVENTVKDKENIFIPKGNVSLEIPSISANSTLNPLPWISYLSNFFFQAVGIPQIILGGSQEFTDATAKIAYLAFETTIADLQASIEEQLWAQLSLKIKLNFPASLQNEMLSDQAKQPSPMQQNDTIAGRGQ